MQGFHPQKHKAVQPKNYANGGIVKGPGSGTSDSVPAMVPRDGFVLPADTVQALGFKPGMRPAEAPQGAGPALGFRPGAKRVQLSNGEAVLTPDQVQAAGGFQALDAMKAATHTPVPEQGAEGPKFFFANGGPLDDEKRKPFMPTLQPDVQRDMTKMYSASMPPRPQPAPAAAQPTAASGFVSSMERNQRAIDASTASGMPEKPGTPAAQANAQAAGNVNVRSQPNGVMEFSGENISGDVSYSGPAGFKPRGAVSAQNMAAADNLAQRSAARGFTPRSQETQPQGPQVAVMPNTGGYGLMDATRLRERELRMATTSTRSNLESSAGYKARMAGAAEALSKFQEEQTEGPRNAAERELKAQELAMRGQEMQDARGFRSGQLANDSARLGLEANSPERQGQSVIQAMRARVAQEQDPSKRQGLVQHMRDLEGKSAPTTTPPAGFRWTANGQSLEAIPGGPAAIVQTEERRTRDSAHDQTRQTIGTINRLMEHPGRMGATGTWNLGRMVPGSDASDFAAEVETLKAQTFLPMVQQLRGMGALSNAEGEKLNAAVGALRFDMSEKAFNESLSRIRDQFGSALGRAGVDVKDVQSWGLDHKQQAAPGPTGQQQRTINRAGTLNGRRVVEYSDGSIGYAD